MPDAERPILILGAGINGAALARELVLNAVPVVLVDQADMAFGATAYSSRLIHGGLRYLEYGEFDLVRESLAERTRLLRLAPQFVHPLRLFIPIENRFGGLWTSASRFLFKGGRVRKARKPGKPQSPRGLWLVRMGLRLYDLYGRDPELPRHDAHRAGGSGAISVAPKYRWLCSYSDAQVRFPERFVVSLLTDASEAAAQNGGTLEVFNYHTALLDGRACTIRPRDEQRVVRTLQPAAIVNATGAWVDHTLAALHVPSPRLMGGTKGSHIITGNDALRRALDGRGLYAEAADGRPVFVLPFGDMCLIGTTDERYEGDPADAVARRDEIEYLLATVNELFPQIGLSEQDVAMHYSGVRPLPFVGDATPASVTRRHAIAENPAVQVPFFSVIGGKLTTCRALAEETAALVLRRVGREVTANSEDRPLPGAEDCPREAAAVDDWTDRVARETGFATAQVRAAFELLGTRCAAILADADPADRDNLPGTNLPTAVARFSIRHEWVAALDDLVERRLMLLYHHPLSAVALRRAAELLVEEGRIDRSQIEAQVAHCAARLRTHFGKRLEGDSSV